MKIELESYDVALLQYIIQERINKNLEIIKKISVDLEELENKTCLNNIDCQLQIVYKTNIDYFKRKTIEYENLYNKFVKKEGI